MSSRIMVDAGGPGENPPVETPEEPVERREPDPVQSPPPREPPSQGEPAEEPTEDEKQAALQKRMDRMSWETHEAKRQRDEARAELQRFWDAQQRATQPPPNQDYQRGLYDAEQQRVANEFNRACDNLFNRGVEEFGQEMGEARDRLVSVGYGPARPDALAAITQLPDGHRVYRELSRDLDRAARILTLAPIPMALELARLSESNGPRETPDSNAGSVSRAPEPVRRIGGQSRRADLPLDHPNMTVAEHIRRRDALERRSRIMR